MIPTVSVHFRSHHAHRNELKIPVHYKRDRFEVTGLNPDSTGLELRSDIEAKVGERVGQLFIFRHQELPDGWRLRQASISRKPQHITTFPERVILEEERFLSIYLNKPDALSQLIEKPDKHGKITAVDG